jgi:hypothetical protein
MADRRHLSLLRRGVKEWNEQRPKRPDLSGALLSGQNLEGVDLSYANLDDAKLSRAFLRRANMLRASLRNATLSNANLYKADLAGVNAIGARFNTAALYRANLTAAILAKANFTAAHLEKATLVAANLRNANFERANLSECSLTRSNVNGASFSGARIYGAGIWDIRGVPRQQEGLVITRQRDAPVTVDNLKVGQFVYLLLNNPDIRDVIDTITSRAVLLLGRFSERRKRVLDALRESLRQRNLSPIVFDFDVPESRDVSETVKVLAGLAKFVLVDITDATEVRAELQSIVKEFPSLPVQPIILAGRREYVGFKHLAKFPWVLPPFKYKNLNHLLTNVDQEVIAPALIKLGDAQAVPVRGLTLV